MADRAHKTRQKPTFRVPVAKPRNPVLVPAMKRAAGPHRKSPGAVRLADKRALRDTRHGTARDDETPDE